LELKVKKAELKRKILNWLKVQKWVRGRRCFFGLISVGFWLDTTDFADFLSHRLADETQMGFDADGTES